MSELQKKFSSDKQLKDDYMSSIRILTNVIPLLKRAGKIEKELVVFESIIFETKEDIVSLSACKKFSSDDNELNLIESKINKLKTQNIEALNKRSDFSKELAEINDQIKEYSVYALALEGSMSEITDFSFVEPEKFNADELIAYIFTRTTKHSVKKGVNIPIFSAKSEEISDIIKKSTFCDFKSFVKWVKNYYNP